jgi:transcription-repair coupling factor (superfamily II helicase)
VDIRIPEEYLPQINLRLNLYKRISSAESLDDLERIRDEIEDRYGSLPSSVQNLLSYGAVKLLAQKLKIKGIDRLDSKLIFDFFPDSTADLGRLPQILKRFGGSMSPQGVMSLRLIAQDESIVLHETIAVLKELEGM